MMRAYLTLAFATALLLALLSPTQASAHELGVSRGHYVAEPGGLAVELVFAERELRGPAETLVKSVVVSAAGTPCAGSLVSTAPTDDDGRTTRLFYRCGRDAQTYAVSFDLFAQLSHGHRHLARVGDRTEHVLFGARRAFEVARARAPAAAPESPQLRAAFDWMWHGVYHILTGYDHLLFVFALLLGAARFSSLLLLASTFTLAHSTTLALAAFGVATPPASWIEPLIALSVAYVGFENLSRRAGSSVAIVFVFGLVHGFGFASVLTEVATPRAELPFALLFFNLGVELGQLAVILAVFPLVGWLRARPPLAGRLVPACSAAIVLAGLAWFTARVLGA